MKTNWTKFWKIVRVILEILVGLSAIGELLYSKGIKDLLEEVRDKNSMYRKYAYNMRRHWKRFTDSNMSDFWRDAEKKCMNLEIEQFEDEAKAKDFDIYDAFSWV